MAYVADPNLAGFNPLKAIGRALGAPGRALVAAIPVVGQAAQQVLDVAARQPAKAQAAAPPALPAATGAQPTVTGTATTTDATTGTRDALLDTVNLLLAKQNQPQTQPTPISYNVQSPAPQAAPMPQWAIPAAIGGVGLLAVLAMMGRR